MCFLWLCLSENVARYFENGFRRYQICVSQNEAWNSKMKYCQPLSASGLSWKIYESLALLSVSKLSLDCFFLNQDLNLICSFRSKIQMIGLSFWHSSRAISRQFFFEFFSSLKYISISWKLQLDINQLLIYTIYAYKCFF